MYSAKNIKMDTEPRFRPTEWESTVRIRGHILAYFCRDGGYSIQVDTSDTRRIRIGYVYPVYPTDTQKYCQIHAEYRQNTCRIQTEYT